MHNFSNLFDKILYVFRPDPLPIIRSISTLYTQQLYVMLVLMASAYIHSDHTPGYADRLLASSQLNLCDIYLLLCVQC
jgi:hypothetical protein